MTNTVKFYLGLIPAFVLVCIAEAIIPANITKLAMWMGMYQLPSIVLGIMGFLGIAIISIFTTVAVAQMLGVTLSPKTQQSHNNDNNVLRLHQGGKDHNK